MRDFRKLNVWAKSHQMTLEVYGQTKRFPREELYGLTSQFRRAMASVPLNIAESCGRSSDADRARFIDMSMGSSCEAEYLILLSRDLGYLPADDAKRLDTSVQEVKRMLVSYSQRLREDA